MDADRQESPSPPGPYRRAWLLSIVAVALGLRLGFVLFYPQYPFGLGDDAGYDESASNLAAGRGFVMGTAPVSPVIRIAPGYPLFLASVYGAFGHSLTAVRVVQSLVGAAVILVLFPVVVDVFGTRVAKWSSALIAVYPGFAIYSGVVLSEMVSCFCLAVLVRSLVSASRSRSRSQWVWAGIMMGATILTRQETAAMLLFICALVCFLLPWRIALAHLSVFLIVAAVCVGAWTVRNYRTFHEFVLVSAWSGSTLWITAKGWDEWRADDPELSALTVGLDPVASDRRLGRAAIADIVADPVAYLRRGVRRFIMFWVGSHSGYLVGLADSFGAYYARREYGRLCLKGVLLLGNLAVILAGAAGTWLVLRRWRGRPSLEWFFVIPGVTISAVHVLVFSTARYQVPIMPFVIILASVAIAARWPKDRTATAQRAGLPNERL